MGIPFLFKWLRNKQYQQVLKRSVPQYVSSFSFDFNGILHNVAQMVYAYGEGTDPKRRSLVEKADPMALEAEYHQALVAKLNEVIAQVRPQEILVLAVDGVAPQAKIAQQRQRRYRSALDAAKGGMKEGAFNPSVITPGTEFMKRTDNFIQRWLVSMAKSLPPKVIYSSHMTPGEGEHQILSLMRNGEIVGNGAHVIYGMDADLIMLGLMAPLNNIHLMREDISSVIDIDNLRLALKTELSLETAVEDFVVMIFLLGNDFLPHIVSLADLDEGIEAMMETYKGVGKSLTKGARTENWDIDWPNMAIYLTALGMDENRLLDMESRRDVKYPSRMMQRATVRTSNIGMDKTDVNVARTSKFDPNIFRGAWYENVFSLKAKNDVFSKLLPGNNFGSSNAKMVEMIKSYLVGIAWVFRYYSLGMEFVNNDYVYRYHYAPLISDIAFMAKNIGEKFKIDTEKYYYNKNAVEVNPVHQLLAVLPIQSKDLLPEEVRHLAKMDSMIADYFPTSAVIERDGLNTEWQGTVLINFVDMARIVDAVNQTTIFTQSRINEFSPVNLIVLTKDVEVVDLAEKNKKFRDFLKKEGGSGRGRGRGYQKSEGSGRGYQKSEGRGYQKSEGRGYQGNKESGRGYQKSESQGRGYQGKKPYQNYGRGQGRGSQTAALPPLPLVVVAPAKPTTFKPLPVQRFEL